MICNLFLFTFVIRAANRNRRNIGGVLKTPLNKLSINLRQCNEHEISDDLISA